MGVSEVEAREGGPEILHRSCVKLVFYRKGIPKTRGTFLGVPIGRTIEFGGLYWGPLL